MVGPEGTRPPADSRAPVSEGNPIRRVLLLPPVPGPAPGPGAGGGPSLVPGQPSYSFVENTTRCTITATLTAKVSGKVHRKLDSCFAY